MTGIVQDLRFSFRSLLKQPGFALIAIGTLALAIGANTAVFSVLDKVLIRPLPIADPDRVVVIWPRERANPTTIGEISHWTFRSWQQDARSFEALAAIGSVNWNMVLREQGEAATLPVAAVSASFFPLVRTPAALGRTLLPEDDRRGAANVVVMSHGCWVRRFDADTQIVGRRLTLDGTTYTVVGVMPDGFDYPRGADLWVPLVPQLVEASTPQLNALEAPWFGVLFVLGRLQPQVTEEQARAEVSGLVARNAGDAFSPGMDAVLTPIREHIFGKTRPALLALGASVALVLFIACANVAALLLVRATSRSHETAVRIAIGAGRWRILRESLSDALVLSVLAGILGVVLARWAVMGLVALTPVDVPRLSVVHLDLRSLVFAWCACLVTAALAGLAPGLHAFHWNIGVALRTRSSRLTRSRALRRGFVVAQIALALTLLVGAGLVGRSFVNLVRLDFGFNPTNVLTLDVTVPNANGARRTAFYTALLEGVRALPGVEAAGAIFLRPLEHTAIGLDAAILIEGQRIDPVYRDRDKNPSVNYETVTADYFRTMRMPVIRGRGFTEADTDKAPQVVIVSDGLARRLWPGQEAVGKRLLRPGAPKDAKGQLKWSTVVGVVEDVRYRGLTDVRFDLYVPYLQRPEDPVKHLMVRTSADMSTMSRTLRAEAIRLDPTALVEGARAMDDVVSDAIAPWRFSATTIAILSALALGLAIMGVYGVVRQAVIERVREIAVRVALGALPHDIVRLVLNEGLLLTATGIVLGLALAIGVGRAISSLLFGVQPLDPVTLIIALGLFVVVAIVAMLLPAVRAVRVDPLVALRYE
jgi:putative ABC transport system permease protein